MFKLWHIKGISTKKICHAEWILPVKGLVCVCVCVCACVCGGGEGGLVNPLKKEKFLTKIFFSNNVEWSSKNLWKMISADVKDNKNNKK